MGNTLKIGGIIGTGTLGVLGAGMIVSEMLQLGLTWLFGLALFIFVTAGAIALISRSVR